jgi:hypothetical protein
MKRPGAGFRTFLVFALLALPGCSEEQFDPDDYDFEIQSARLRIRGYGRSRADVCGGTLAWMDSYVNTFAEPFDLPDGLIGDYAWVSEEIFSMYLPEICGGGTLGCTNSDSKQIFTSMLVHEHELFHLVRASRHQPCVPFLEEGLAEHFQGTRPLRPQVGDGDMMRMLDNGFAGRIVGDDYSLAGHFVTFLIEQYGLDATLELCKSTPTGSSRATFDANALEIYGKTLDGLLTEYALFPHCEFRQLRSRVRLCEREPVLFVDNNGPAALNIEMTCDSEMAIGPRHDRFFVSFQIGVTEVGSHVVKTVNSAGERLQDLAVRIEECAPCSADPFIGDWGPGELVLLTPPIGYYVVELDGPIDFDDNVQVVFE